MGKIAWITGANGQIGTRLVLLLHSRGWEVVSIVRDASAPASKGITHEWDMSREPLITKLLPPPDAVVHLAAQTSAYAARCSPSADAETNLIGFLRLLDSLIHYDHPPHVVLAGAATEVGGGHGATLDDRCLDAPQTFYDVAKVCQRNYLLQYQREGWLVGTALRFSNVYGGVARSQMHRAFINQSLRDALRGDPLYYFEGGPYLRDYLHVDDAAEAIAETLHSRGQVSGKTYLVGSGASISIQEALEVMVDVAYEVVGLQSKILAKPVPPDAYPIETRSVRINPAGFQRATGWKSRVTFKDGVRRLALASTRS